MSGNAVMTRQGNSESEKPTSAISGRVDKIVVAFGNFFCRYGFHKWCYFGEVGLMGMQEIRRCKRCNIEEMKDVDY